MKTFAKKLRKPVQWTKKFARFNWIDEKAQTLGEYSVLIMLIALAAIIALTLLGNKNVDLLSTIGNAF